MTVKIFSLHRLIYLVIALIFAAPSGAQKPGPTKARPLLAGNYPDPTILRHDGIYYMTHSSFRYRPGLLIWRSEDLRQWTPVTYALKNFEGNVWAPELIEHEGHFYIYFPSAVEGRFGNYVIRAENIEGPWSEAHALGVGHIDPGHVVADDGQRYLHLSGGHVVELTEDGLRAAGEPWKVHEGWPIPEDWAIECFCLESPKLTQRQGLYYLTTAQGGTFGPSTSHMITAFRSKSLLGPWESSPYNPVIHTWSREEEWWSKGHGTLVEAEGGQWFMVLHGIRNGYRTLGRSTLIEPVEWGKDDWYYVPDQWPAGWEDSFEADLPLSDDFERKTLGKQWQFYEQYGEGRYHLAEGALILQGAGDNPGNSWPLTLIPRDVAYEIETEVEVLGDARAGLMLFVSPDEYIGLSVDQSGRVRREQKNFKRYRNTEEPSFTSKRFRLRIVNDRQDVRFYVKTPGRDWELMQPSMEISQNGIVRAALFAYGRGQGRFKYFDYRKLNH